MNFNLIFAWYNKNNFIYFSNKLNLGPTIGIEDVAHTAGKCQRLIVRQEIDFHSRLLLFFK